ncbi:MAG: polysaccharide biosynthesis/export family protein [Acidobacteria bacterium]|nr:polysaccharide biosynthesis/export family protein [Acidobacteriota bacterium]
MRELPMYLRLIPLFAFLFAFSVGALAQGLPVKMPVGADNAKGYLIGPGDEITVKVLGEEQFDFVATVDSNGKIEVPFFDQPLTAKCLSEPELRKEVTKLLSKFLRSPQLNLRVTERNSRPKVTVFGEVRTPSQIDLKRRATLIEVLSAAGGVTEDAGGTLQVFRTQAPKIISANYDLILKGKQKDIMLEPYDIVEVDKAKKSIFQTVLEIATNSAKTIVGQTLPTRILY